MALFRNSLDRPMIVGPCLLLCGLLLPMGGLVAEEPAAARGAQPSESDVKPLRAEKPETGESTLPPRPRPETRAERRERLRHQASSGIGGVMNLIGLPQIQHELKLSDAQRKEIADQTRSLRLYVRSQFLDVIEMPENRQTAELRKLRRQTRPVVEKRQKTMLNVLTDEQRMRLLGISLQMRGPRSLLDEEVIELLELTGEQVEAILAILEEHDVKLQKLIRNAPAGSEAPLVTIRAADSRKSMNEKVEKQILEVLTDVQREKFKDLQGEPYAMHPDGPLPTPVERSENDEKQTLKELVPDN